MRTITIYLFSLVCVLAFGQPIPQHFTFTPAGPGAVLSTFQLKVKDTSLEGAFIGDQTAKRPLIIFIPGSGPVPVYCSLADTAFIPLFPHQLLDPRFNFILLSKPGIPAFCKQQELDSSYYYMEPTTGKEPETYLAHNTLGFYRQAFSSLLDALPRSVQVSQVVMMGHSQGARIAAEFTDDPRVDKVVYMSADPLGRIATLYDQEYVKYNQRDPEKAKLMDAIFLPANADSTLMRERYNSFASFSKPSIIGLSKATRPTLVVYGDMDKSCPNGYALAHLDQYVSAISVRCYPGLDHNYFDAHRKNHWREVVQDVMDWILGE